MDINFMMNKAPDGVRMRYISIIKIFHIIFRVEIMLFYFFMFMFKSTQLYADTSYISGTILEIEEKGQILLTEDGSGVSLRVRLWGLEILNNKAAKSFLTGRKISCNIVHLRDDLPSVFCFGSPTLLGSKPRSLWISLFDWLPEMGFAKFQCSEGDMGKAVEAPDGQKWLCKGLKSPYFGPTKIQ